MKQQQISFTDIQDQYLKAEAERLEISKSELVRRALDWYRETYPPKFEIQKDEEGK